MRFLLRNITTSTHIKPTSTHINMARFMNVNGEPLSWSCNTLQHYIEFRNQFSLLDETQKRVIFNKAFSGPFTYQLGVKSLHSKNIYTNLCAPINSGDLNYENTSLASHWSFKAAKAVYGCCPAKDQAIIKKIQDFLHFKNSCPESTDDLAYYAIHNNAPGTGGRGDMSQRQLSNPNTSKAIPSSRSMSVWHQFIVIRDFDISLCNGLTFGYDPETCCLTQSQVDKAIHILEDCHKIFEVWCQDKNISEDDALACVHVYPNNSVQSLHVHLISTKKNHINLANWDTIRREDGTLISPGMNQKNIPIKAILQYLRQLEL